MSKAYFPKPSAILDSNPKPLNNSDDFDDALLDDPEDDYVCSQIFDLAEVQTSTPLPVQSPAVNPQHRPPPVSQYQFRPTVESPLARLPSDANRFQRPQASIATVVASPQSRTVTPQFQRPQVPVASSPYSRPFNQYQSRPSIDSPSARLPSDANRFQRPQALKAPMTSPQCRPVAPQIHRPQATIVPRPPVQLVTTNLSVVQSIEKPPDAKYDQLVGEICMLKERMKFVNEQYENERKAKQELWEAKEADLAELKSASEKKINKIQSELTFKEVDTHSLKAKLHETERQLKEAKAQLEGQALTQPLPYSLPIVMHRKLDFSPNKGFVDWDDSVTLNDVLDI